MNQKKTVMTSVLLKIFGVIWIVVMLIPVLFSSAKSWGNWSLGWDYTKSLYTIAVAISPALYAFYWIDKLETEGGKISAITTLKRLAILLCLITVVIAVIGIGIGDRHNTKSMSKDTSEGFVLVLAAESLDGKILCKANGIWFGFPGSGDCDTFTPPSNIAVGEKFTANGKERTIGFIQAIQADKDWEDQRSGVTTKKGEWLCAAAEHLDDLDTDPEHNDKALWLVIEKCQPVQTSSERSVQENGIYDNCLLIEGGDKATCGAMLREVQRAKSDVVVKADMIHRNPKTGEISYYVDGKILDKDGKEVDPGFSDVPSPPPGVAASDPAPGKH